MILLVTLAVPVAADPTISGISPTLGYRGNTVTLTITGSGFDLPTTSSYSYVRLMMEDQSNITASSITSKSSTKIVAKVVIRSAKEKGVWSVVVVNSDGSENVFSDSFTISDEMAISSISPTYAKTNNDDVSFTLTGSGLSDVQEVYLYKSGYDNLTTADLSTDTSSVTGTFDLTDIDDVTYKVCVMDSLEVSKCSSSVTFEVTTDQAGEIDLSSSPSNANVYVDSSYVGITPYAMTDVAVGSHVVKITKDGYSDWSKIVKVTDGDTTSVDAELSAIPTTVVTTVQTSVPTTEKTTLPVTTVKVPTSWPTGTATTAQTTTTATTTKESPVEGIVVLGAIGLGIVLLHRK